MEEESRSTDVENMNRRDLMKNAGLAALGMIYTRPTIETIVVESAFASYGDSTGASRPDTGGDPGQEAGKKDSEFSSHVFLRGIFRKSP